MANYCYNSLNIIDADRTSINFITSWLDRYKEFNTMKEWYDELLSVQNKIDEPCTRWFDFEYSIDLNSDNSQELYISGDTAWAPTEKLALAISKEFNCCVNLVYEESGNDIGGDIIYENGEIRPLYQGTYHGYRLWDEGVYYLYREIDNYFDDGSEPTEAVEFLEDIVSRGGVKVSDTDLVKIFTHIKDKIDENNKK